MKTFYAELPNGEIAERTSRHEYTHVIAVCIKHKKSVTGWFDFGWSKSYLQASARAKALKKQAAKIAGETWEICVLPTISKEEVEMRKNAGGDPPMMQTGADEMPADFDEKDLYILDVEPYPAYLIAFIAPDLKISPALRGYMVETTGSRLRALQEKCIEVYQATFEFYPAGDFSGLDQNS